MDRAAENASSGNDVRSLDWTATFALIYAGLVDGDVPNYLSCRASAEDRF
jgi:hypothetical protein